MPKINTADRKIIFFSSIFGFLYISLYFSRLLIEAKFGLLISPFIYLFITVLSVIFICVFFEGWYKFAQLYCLGRLKRITKIFMFLFILMESFNVLNLFSENIAYLGAYDTYLSFLLVLAVGIFGLSFFSALYNQKNNTNSFIDLVGIFGMITYFLLILLSIISIILPEQIIFYALIYILYTVFFIMAYILCSIFMYIFSKKE